MVPAGVLLPIGYKTPVTSLTFMASLQMLVIRKMVEALKTSGAERLTFP